MQTKYKTRLLSLALAACLALNLCTTAALAAEGTEQPGATGEEPYGVTYLWESVESDGGGCRARFNWMTGTDITQSVLLYAKKSDFETNGNQFTERVEGTSDRIDLTTQLASLGYKGGTADYDGSGSYCYAPVQSHKAETGVLEPGTEYVYCVGDGGENTTSFSEPRTFTAPEEDIDHFDMIFFSDAQQGGGGYEDTREGYQEDLHMALSQAVADFPDAAFLMSGGDQVNFGFDTWEWDSFFLENQDIFDHYPLYLAAGNHECGGDSNGLGWVDPSLNGEPVDSTASALLGRYNPPENGAAYYGAGADGTEPMVGGHAGMEAMAGNYYFIYGNTLFMVIDYQDHTDEALVAAEQEWVKSVVKNHPDVTWRVAVMHESMFGYRVTDPAEGMNAVWSDTFDAAGVDVVLMGHDHIYTRTGYYSGQGAGYPQEEGSGTVYVTAASANTDNRSDYYAVNPYVEIHSEGGYGRAYCNPTPNTGTMSGGAIRSTKAIPSVPPPVCGRMR